MVKEVREMCRTVISVVAVATAGMAFGHGSAILHYRDLDLITGGYSKTVIGEIARDISDSIDNEMAPWFRQRFGPVPGNHRILSHGYTLGEAIPRETLDAVRSRYGEAAVSEVIKKQQEVSGKYLKQLMEKAGLPRKQANAMLRLFSNGHLVGDLMEDNKLTSIVKDFDSICKSQMSAVEDLFGRANPDYVSLFKKEIGALQKTSLPVAEKSEKLAQLMGKLKLDTELKKTFGSTLEKNGVAYSADMAIARNSKLAERALASEQRRILVGAAQDTAKIAKEIGERAKCIASNLAADYRGSTTKPLGGKISVRPGENIATASRRIAEENATKLRAMEPALRQANPGVKNCKVVIGLAKRVPTKAGMRTALIVPGSAATSSLAGTAGTAAAAEFGGAFVISEGLTVFSYARDSITEHEFYDETARNLIASAASAAAVYVAVALGASAGGPIVMAVAVGAYLVADITYRVVKYLCRLEVFSLDDVLGALPGEFDDAHGILNPEKGVTILDPCDEPNILNPAIGEGVLNPFNDEETILDGF